MRTNHRPWTWMPAILVLIGHGYPLDVQVTFDGEGRRAQILVQHIPADEPVAALKLRLKLRPAAGVQSVSTLKPNAGPWSQFLPQAALAGGQLTAYAMAPASGEGKDKEIRTVARFELALSPTAPVVTATDLIDSVFVEEAYGTQGKPMQLSKRLSTGLGKAPSQSAGSPVERIRGGVRTLTFNLAKAQRVRAFVTDPRGRRVADIADRKMPAGLNEISWDGRASGGKPLASGTYLLRLQTGSFNYDRRVEVAP